MAKKKKRDVSASLRWSVFARDGFACRYCGARAGDPGVSLHADHIVSKADGGADTYENLVAACQRCNGGKGARSLASVPDSAEVAQRMKERAESIRQQAQAMADSLEVEKQIEQEAVNLKCTAYDVDKTVLLKGEAKHIIGLCGAYGAENVLKWYRAACRNNVKQDCAIKYVYGIIRHIKKQEAANG